MICLVINFCEDYSAFNSLSLLKLQDSAFCRIANLGKFLDVVSSDIFSPTFFCLPLTWILDLPIYYSEPQCRPLAYFPSIRLGNLNCFVFRFTDFLPLLSSTIHHCVMWWILNFQLLYCSVLKFPLVLLYVFYFFSVTFCLFADHLSICFNHAHNCLFKHFYECCFKILAR